MELRDQMEKIYGEMPLENIPWNLTTPPALLTQAVTEGRIKPCRVVDLGCGAGNYSIWLARQGFHVTGIDFSENAIGHAHDLAARQKVACRFIVADLLGEMDDFKESFELAIDWEVLHHIFPADRQRYIKNVHSLLRPLGLYFSLCFSDRDPEFGGKGKYRNTPLGTTLYFSSEEELTDLFQPFFKILELSTIEVPGKHRPHLANVAWLKKKLEIC